MSFLYTFYNNFPMYPQTLLTIIAHTTPQNAAQTYYIPNTHSNPVQTLNIENSQPILPPNQPTCQSLNISEKTGRFLRQKKSLNRKILKKKDQVFGRRKQNKQRNMMSFIFKGYVQQIFQERGMIKFIEQYSKKRSIDSGVSRFYEFMVLNFPIRKTYIGIRYIHELLTSDSSEPAMIQILSLTLRLYLKQMFPILIIQATQTDKKQRLVLLKKGRSIASILFTK